MPIDRTAFHNLERLFRAQVEKDREHSIERVVQGCGVYLPCVEPKGQVDYVFVGMEPSFGWANGIEHAEKKIAEGMRNFARSGNDKEPLSLFILSIKRFLCQQGGTYHLTDVSKGAMPVTVAALDRNRRYEEWYPLLLREIEIVGKPSAPVIAIGKKVEAFLKKRDLDGTTGRSLQAVPHYSPQASGFYKIEAENDREGFKAFKKTEFGENNRWEPDLSPTKKRLVFAYKKRFEAIQGLG